MSTVLIVIWVLAVLIAWALLDELEDHLAHGSAAFSARADAVIAQITAPID